MHAGKWNEIGGEQKNIKSYADVDDDDDGFNHGIKIKRGTWKLFHTASPVQSLFLFPSFPTPLIR